MNLFIGHETGKSKTGSFRSHDRQFICTNDKGWFLFFGGGGHISWVCSSGRYQWSGCRLKSGWSQARDIISLCSIMTMFVSAFFHFTSIMSVSYWCRRLGLRRKIARLICPSVQRIAILQAKELHSVLSPRRLTQQGCAITLILMYIFLHQ